jgi:outer membrane lipopolysaccharide assembly protein LptE/RlpB
MTMTQRRHRVAVVLICLAWLGLSGCGYALAGRGAFLPDYIKTIGVPNLVNNTTAFDVELALTARVRQEFIGRGKYKVVPEATGADAVLTGDISSISITPTAFNDQQQATRYAVVMVVKMEFKDEQSGKVLWENPSLTFREEYDVILVSGTVTDPSVFFGSSNNALDRISQDFARTVVSSILEAF